MTRESAGIPLSACVAVYIHSLTFRHAGVDEMVRLRSGTDRTEPFRGGDPFKRDLPESCRVVLQRVVLPLKDVSFPRIAHASSLPSHHEDVFKKVLYLPSSRKMCGGNCCYGAVGRCAISVRFPGRSAHFASEGSSFRILSSQDMYVSGTMARGNGSERDRCP